jgi:hypothetical protein
MFKGLQSLWGSFAQAVERSAVSMGDALRTAFGLAQVGQAPVDVPVLRQELAHIRRESETAPQIAALGRNEAIPESLYTETNIPWKSTFGYEVEFYGRDLATGRYAHTSRIVTSSEELTPGEVLDIANERFGASGAYPQLSISQMAVTGAYTRAGEIPF